MPLRPLFAKESLEGLSAKWALAKKLGKLLMSRIRSPHLVGKNPRRSPYAFRDQKTSASLKTSKWEKIAETMVISAGDYNKRPSDQSKESSRSS
jgi:hypothetical protein